jgi:hypothetical protein
MWKSGQAWKTRHQYYLMYIVYLHYLHIFCSVTQGLGREIRGKLFSCASLRFRTTIFEMIVLVEAEEAEYD